MLGKANLESGELEDAPTRTATLDLTIENEMKKNLSSYVMVFVLLAVHCSLSYAGAVGKPYYRVNQGAGWNASGWNRFYSQDQGSRIIPYSWIVALKQPDGQLFLRDSLSRYGYIKNAKNAFNPQSLPVGFLVVGSGSNAAQFSMTCAACHTRQITVGEKNYRIDGGPSLSDPFNFFKDLETAVGFTLDSPAAFTEFQNSVAAQGQPAPSRDELNAWYQPYHVLISKSFTDTTMPYGVGRLDALGLIQNRAAGLDIGLASDAHLIPGNISPATVPVRFPFIWNAPKQDLTQWAGTTTNGNDSYALQRNGLEVIGVFGYLYPVPDPSKYNGANFLSQNSLNYNGLKQAENLVKKIGPPKWPWAINHQLARKGKIIYAAECGPGCHEIAKGEPRPPQKHTWKTPILNVGTDTRYYETLALKTVSSGLLTGTVNPFSSSPEPIPATGAPPISLVNDLSASALFQKYPKINLTPKAPANGVGSFESRVLQGIWAAAPYLHNGSVPSLAELLKPADQRVKVFKVGSSYDIESVGLAPDQPFAPTSVTLTTDCSHLSSGNSNCGHEFGVGLSPDDKAALLEYLKTL